MIGVDLTVCAFICDQELDSNRAVVLSQVSSPRIEVRHLPSVQLAHGVLCSHNLAGDALSPKVRATQGAMFDGVAYIPDSRGRDSTGFTNKVTVVLISRDTLDGQCIDSSQWDILLVHVTIRLALILRQEGDP